MGAKRLVLLAGLLASAACAPTTEPRPNGEVEKRMRENTDLVDTLGPICRVVLTFADQAECDTDEEHAWRPADAGVSAARR